MWKGPIKIQGFKKSFFFYTGICRSIASQDTSALGPFTQAIFVAPARCNFVASSFKHVRNPCDIAATNCIENSTWFNLATKIALSCRDKIRLWKRAFTIKKSAWMHMYFYKCKFWYRCYPFKICAWAYLKFQKVDEGVHRETKLPSKFPGISISKSRLFS